VTIENTPGVSGGTGLIGGEVLHRFTVIFDYNRQRIILEPNRHLRDESSVDASGADLRLAPESKSFRVHSVRKGSPAAEAGLQEGDLITAIDRTPSTEFNLDQAQRMFARDGREYLLNVRRGSELLQIRIKLRKLL
jgi:S1-C subfamily serine protease